jgi:hypothetical protein
LFQKDGTDEPDDGLVVGEDADDLGAPFDLAVHTLDRVCGVQLRAMRWREAQLI